MIVTAVEQAIEELCRAKVMALSTQASAILQGSTAPFTAESLHSIEQMILPATSVSEGIIDVAKQAKVRKQVTNHVRLQCDQQCLESLLVAFLKNSAAEESVVTIGSDALHGQLIARMSTWLASKEYCVGRERMTRTLLRTTPQQLQTCVNKLHARDYIDVQTLQSEGLQQLRFKA